MAWDPRMPVVPARARVHRGDELEARRHGRAASRTRDVNRALFEWLPQALQGFPPELGQLVQEENAAVCEGNLTGCDGAAAADQPGEARRMVGGAKRPPTGEATGPASRRRQDRCDFDAFVEVHRRKEVDQPLCEHRLARARRPDKQKAVPAGGGDLEREFAFLLAPHVVEAARVAGLAGLQRSGFKRLGGVGLHGVPSEELEHLLDRLGPEGLHVVDRRSLGRRLRRSDEASKSETSSRDSRGQTTWDRMQAPVDPYFTDEDRVREVLGVEVSASGGSRQDEGQIECLTGLLAGCRRQVQVQPPRAEPEPSGTEHAEEPPAALPQNGIGEPRQLDLGPPVVLGSAEAPFDGHDQGPCALHGSTVHADSLHAG